MLGLPSLDLKAGEVISNGSRCTILKMDFRVILCWTILDDLVCDVFYICVFLVDVFGLSLANRPFSFSCHVISPSEM